MLFSCCSTTAAADESAFAPLGGASTSMVTIKNVPTEEESEDEKEIPSPSAHDLTQVTEGEEEETEESSENLIDSSSSLVKEEATSTEAAPPEPFSVPEQDQQPLAAHEKPESTKVEYSPEPTTKPSEKTTVPESEPAPTSKRTTQGTEALQSLVQEVPSRIPSIYEDKDEDDDEDDVVEPQLLVTAGEEPQAQAEAEDADAPVIQFTPFVDNQPIGDAKKKKKTRTSKKKVTVTELLDQDERRKKQSRKKKSSLKKTSSRDNKLSEEERRRKKLHGLIVHKAASAADVLHGVPIVLYEDVLGPFLKSYDSDRKLFTVTALQNKELVLFYFGAQWRPECKAFTQQLEDVVRAAGRHEETACVDIAVVYISADRHHFEYHDAPANMPAAWLAMPPGTSRYKNRLSQDLDIADLPTLVILDHDGCVIRKNAVEQIQNAVDDSNGDKISLTEKAGALVKEWLACPNRLPLQQSSAPALTDSDAVRKGILRWEASFKEQSEANAGNEAVEDSEAVDADKQDVPVELTIPKQTETVESKAAENDKEFETAAQPPVESDVVFLGDIDETKVCTANESLEMSTPTLAETDGSEASVEIENSNKVSAFESVSFIPVETETDITRDVNTPISVPLDLTMDKEADESNTV